MFRAIHPVILASASPRRQKFLSDLGIAFTASAADIDETARPGEQPDKFALRMAADKAAVLADQYPAACIIAADTVVTIDDLILGKPMDEDHALTMLRRLCGATHQVITGVCLACRDKKLYEVFARTTRVWFADFPDAVLKAYIRTGESMDKAGAYGIQGKGGFLVSRIDGSCSNVVGLPVHDCITRLIEMQVISPVVHAPGHKTTS
jgi:septum formation protein